MMKRFYTIAFILIYIICVLTATGMDGRCPNRSGMTREVNEDNRRVMSEPEVKKEVIEDGKRVTSELEVKKEVNENGKGVMSEPEVKKEVNENGKRVTSEPEVMRGVNEVGITKEMKETRQMSETREMKEMKETKETRQMSESDEVDGQQKRKIPFGYDGGMMIHTGFLTGTINQIDHKASGVPFGIGGAIKFHIGKYLRIGSEGYVSTLKQLGNGSNIKFGWGGILADVRFDAGKLMPYVGLTIGGGARTSTLMLEGNNSDWENEQSVILNRTPFMAVAPFVGTDIVMTKKFHLTVKLDCLCAINRGKMLLPAGPRLYFGFLMYH